MSAVWKAVRSIHIKVSPKLIIVIDVIFFFIRFLSKPFYRPALIDTQTKSGYKNTTWSTRRARNTKQKKPTSKKK